MSRLIQLVMGGPWSHVAVAWWLHDRLMVVQQKDVKGCQILMASKLLPFDWIATGITELSPCAKSHAFRDLGKNYSYLDAIRLALRLPVLHPDRTCSTFATKILNLSGKEITLDNADPVTLVNYLLATNHSLISVTE